MALFVVCIPREKYEKVITSGRVSSEDENDAKNEIYTSASSISLLASSLESNPSGPLVRPEAVENLAAGDSAEKEDVFRTPREIPGSLDSDVQKHNMELEKRQRENQEAVEKFFSLNNKNAAPKKKSMERAMHDIINRMQIRNVSWQKVNNGNSYKISFSLEKGVRCDDTIHLLAEFGIGQKKGSSCVIVPCSVYKDKSHLKTDADSSELKETSWNRHIGNVRARLNVEKLVYAVKSDATLSFDFTILLVVASMVASFGLMEDSTLILTASMLISPLMGPVLASTFGTIIKDRKLQFWGLRNEIIGIVLCIVVGFFFGVIVCTLDYIFNIEITCTEEMLSRCTWHSVIVGVFIALLSGAAQSIALLRENFGSLVGVAISASLLPPAVNTGLLWSFSCARLIFQYSGMDAFQTLITKESVYSSDPALELFALGSLSLFLTITNVICVYLMGYIFLRIKIEVAPLSSDEERQFWKHDIPITRDYNKTINAEDGRKLREQLNNYCNMETEHFKGVAAELLKQDLYSNTHTWSPLMQKFQGRKENRTSVMDFNAYCNSMTSKIAGGDHYGANKNQAKSFFVKHSDPIATPSTSSQNHENSESMSEPIRRHTTYVEIESTSNEDDKPGMMRKFVVTPAKDDYI